MLQTSALSFSYNAENQMHFPDITLGKGEKCLLLGQSGCGKTTLLHLIAGLLTPAKGTVAIDGNVLGEMSQRALDQFRGQKIGIVFQQNHLLHSLNALENLLVAQYFSGVAKDEARAKLLLEKLGIASKLNAKPQELSQGQRQRLAIARALVNKPALLLADEPTSSLDDRNSQEVLDLLQQHAQEEGAALLVVTHDNRLKGAFEKQVILGG